MCKKIYDAAKVAIRLDWIMRVGETVNDYLGEEL
jgi:hypothetical protein